MISAEEWFDQFLISFADDDKVRKAYGQMAATHGPRMTTKRWTALMLGFLQRMGEKMDYEISGEMLNVDMVWKKGRIVQVAIEHENDGDDVKGVVDDEVEKLQLVDCPLKVLITYIVAKKRKHRYFNETLHQLVDAVLDRISAKPMTSEFLLLVCPWRNAEIPEDQWWIAHKFSPSVKVVELFRPPIGYS